jgi:large subunit ribosomal protein L4
VFILQLKNARKHTASTKTKSSSWWWKQKKGTGNARAGSRRSPLWVGGGYFRTKTTYCFKKVNKKKED